MPKGISSTLELRTFKTFAVLEATCKAPRYLENMAKNQGFCSCGSSGCGCCCCCCCGYPDHLLLLPETSLGKLLLLGGAAGFLDSENIFNPDAIRKSPISQTSLSPYKTLPAGSGNSSNQNASQVAGQSGKALQHFVEKLAFDHHQSLSPLLQFHLHRRSLALLKHTPHIESGRFQKLCHLNSETSAFPVGG